MNQELQIPPRPLDKLKELIMEDLVAAERAGHEYRVAAGEKMLEAQRHFLSNPKGFWAWIVRNFDLGRVQAQRYMDYAIESNKLASRRRPITQPFESIADFERKRGTLPKGESVPKRPYHDAVNKILSKIDPEALKRESERAREELSEIRNLAEQIVNAGYKVIASKLHPDVKGGSAHAMKLLNAARDRLRRAL
jgi:hypothetical protein